MHLVILWGEVEYGCDNTSRLILEYQNGVQGADRAEHMVSVRVITEQSVHWAPVFPHAEEDDDNSTYWSGCCILSSEVRDRVPSDLILLVVQGKENIRYVLEILDGFIRREDLVPNKNNEVQERMELECLEISFCKWCILK